MTDKPNKTGKTGEFETGEFDKAEEFDKAKKTTKPKLAARSDKALEKSFSQQTPISNHWADLAAFKLVKHHDKDSFTLATGISPSGTIHIGNFRELITAELVARALKKIGKKAKFILSWDDFDVFRKVPKNFPQEVDGRPLKDYLGSPLCDLPDPKKQFGSYALGNEKPLEQSAKKVGVTPEYLYQNKKYRAGEYIDGIRQALSKRADLKSILDRFRKEPLDDNWFPICIYCSFCNRDNTKVTDYDEKDTISYQCDFCQKGETLDLKLTKQVKLLWRIDWPMRWAYEQVDFEPGGKDHSSEGGSFDTAKEIVKKIYNFHPPEFLHYDFVRIKGKGGKISSSSGDVLTIDDLLEVYEPEIVRHFFVSIRPNVEFAIDLTDEVIKNYDVYDRLERQYYGQEPIKTGREKFVKRVYEMCQVGEVLEALVYQPSFRHLTSIVQIYSFDLAKVTEFYENKGYLQSEFDRKKLKIRSQKAIDWIKKYAGDAFCFSLRQSPCDFSQIPANYRTGLVALKKLTLLEKEKEKTQKNVDEKAFFDKIYQLIEREKLDNVDFFKTVYHCLIDKDSGPRLGSFLLVLNVDVLELLLPNE